MMVEVQASDPGPQRWLTRNVRILSAVSFLQDAASDLLYPLLPIYLTSVLGAPPRSSARSKALQKVRHR